MYPVVQTDEETWYYTQVCIVSAVITFILFYIFRSLVWNAEFLQGIPDQKKYSVISNMPSYVHATIGSLMATYSLIYDNDLYNDMTWGKSVTASTACAITSGYMLGDLVVILVHWKDIGDWQYVVHHLTSAFSFVYAFRQGVLLYFAMLRLLAEYSTFCVNNRVIFYILNMQNGSAYFYNGLLMVFTFTLARIVPLPFYFYCVLSILGTEGHKHLGMGKYLPWAALLFLDTLNLKWYHRMIKGAIKVWNSHKDNPIADSDHSKTLKQG